MKKRLLVLSISAGAGHVRAAQAIESTAKGQFSNMEVLHIDVLSLVPSGFKKIYGSGYIKLIEKAPLLWAYLYKKTDHKSAGSLFNRLRRAIERLNTRNLEAAIDAFAPDAILCTHFLPAELLSRRIAKAQKSSENHAKIPPTWVLVTDFDVHGLWLHPHMQGYFVANEEVSVRLAARGFEKEKIQVSGISIMSQFTRKIDRAEASKKLNLDPKKFTVIMMAGGAGVGSIDVLAEKVVLLDAHIQVIALAGRNEALLAKLKTLENAHQGRFVAMGFTTTIEEVMAAADVAITKPGGLTTSECLAMNLPMIIVSPIPGQEERNCDNLLENGCAEKAVDEASLLYKIARMQQNPARLAAIRQKQQLLAKPNAAMDILKTISQ